MYGAQAVGQCAEGFGTEFLSQLEALVDVVDVIQAIEGTDHTEAIGVETLGPVQDGVIRQEVKGGQVLGTNQGAELGARRGVLVYEANALPRVFLEVAHGHVELDGRYQVHVLETGVGDVIQQRQDVTRGHAGGPDALVRITQGGIDDVDLALAIGRASARGHDFGEAFCA